MVAVPAPTAQVPLPIVKRAKSFLTGPFLLYNVPMQKTPLAALAFLFLILAFSASAFPRPPALSPVQTYDALLRAIRETRTASQARIEAAAQQDKVREVWETGKLIDQHILLNQERAKYGERVLQRLAFDLGTSQTELSLMLQFARAYPIYSPGNKLSWSHYRSLLAINDSVEREALARRAEEEGWTREQMRAEVQRHKHRTEAPVELPEITPGPLYTYQIIRLKDRLKIDLGFGIYHDLPEKDAEKFKEGGIVRIDSKGRLSVIAGRPPALRAEGPGGKADEAPPKNMAEIPLFTYSATVTSVVDGDTFHALIDLGFETTVAQRVRLRRIDAPEIESAEGKEAKAYLEKILSRDQGRILIQSRDLDQHGRPIADVWVKGKPVDLELLDEGLAILVSE